MNKIQLECLEPVIEKRVEDEFSIAFAEARKFEDKTARRNYINSKTKLREMEIALKLLQEETKKIRNERRIEYSSFGTSNNEINREKLKEFTKAFKHEFLTQIKYYPESFNEIVKNVSLYIPSDSFGICIDTYVYYLWKQGYFKFKDIYDPNSGVYLTGKAERYLEQEANISLKR